MHKKFLEIDRKFNKLIKEASKQRDSDVLFFEYKGEVGVSSGLATTLNFKFPGKIIVVARIVGTQANLSIRGEKIRDKVLNILKNFKDSRGGGHESAMGAQIREKDLPTFIKELNKLVS